MMRSSPRDKRVVALQQAVCLLQKDGVQPFPTSEGGNGKGSQSGCCRCAVVAWRNHTQVFWIKLRPTPDSVSGSCPVCQDDRAGAKTSPAAPSLSLPANG